MTAYIKSNGAWVKIESIGGTPLVVRRGTPKKLCADCKKKKDLLEFEWGYRCKECRAREPIKKRDPRKGKANYLVLRAIIRGKLVRPSTCSRCSFQGKIHAHHYLGYSLKHALYIQWLCFKCHAAEHKRMRRVLS